MSIPEVHIDKGERDEIHEKRTCLPDANKEETPENNHRQESENLCLENGINVNGENGTGYEVNTVYASDDNLVPRVLSSLDDLHLNKEMCNEKLRRNSLPESSLGDIKKSNLKSISNNSSSDISSNEAKLHSLASPSIASDRAKVTPNITEVVKNVHGLFSSLKNVYKEKNIGDMIHATQKNFTSAKNGYFNIKNDMFNDTKQTATQKEIFETLNKYTNLNLAAEGAVLDDIQMETSHFRREKDIMEEDEPLENRESIPNMEENSDSVLNSEETLVSAFEIVVNEQKKQLDELKNQMLQKDKMNNELQTKYSDVCKQLETSVMRYAMSERQILSAEKIRNAAVDKEKKAKEECSLLERRLKTAHLEKTRISNMLDEKSHELLASQKEVHKIKEELLSADTKIKWAHNKLLSEIEAHKESSLLAEKLGQQVAQYEMNCNNGGPSSHPTPQHSHSTLTDVQIKEMEAVTILERHERQRFEEKCKTLQKELEQMKTLHNNAIRHLEELRAQAESSAGEAAALRDICNELRIQAAKDCERLAATQAKAARLDTVTGQLQQEQEKSAKLIEELELERKARSSAQAESELSTRREAELLRQAERLTEAGVRLQATCSEAEAKALALSVDNASLRAAAEREAERVAVAKNEAASEKRGREGDARALAGAAARHQRSERLAVQRVEQLEGELRVMATKHASTVKELKREIQQWKRKCKNVETESQSGLQNSDQTIPKPAQRTGSFSSLSSYDGSTSQQLNEDNTVERQQLVEKIVDLQRAGARRSERLEFLEGHSAQLTAELQKKSKLLRALMASMPAGALAAPASDRAKVEIGKHGGIMASLFNQEVTDNSMSLDLALEITAKLQVVLEDTLLKNITLKENMDTLGDEIALLRDQLKKRPKT